jgi:hypothetical protein
MAAWDQDIPQAPNIAGAGNYMQALMSGLSNLGRPQQPQQRPQQPQNQQPGTPNTPSGNIFSSPFLGGGTAAGGQRSNYLQQLIAALSGRSGGP